MMFKSPKIYFEHWRAGLFNQVISLELAIGLQTLLEHEVILGRSHRSPLAQPDPIFTTPRYRNLLSDSHPNIADLLDWPRKSLFHFMEEEITPLSNQISQRIRMTRTYMNCGRSSHPPAQEFADGRTEVQINPETSLLCTDTLTWYSRYFLNRPAQLDGALAATSFQLPYRELAKQISQSISPFVGAHVRLGDFSAKIHSLSKESVVRGLSYLQTSGLPLYIATDQPSHPMLQQLPIAHTLLDRFILEEYGYEFAQLPFHNHVVLGLIANLVLGNSHDFIGTEGSTYTGYIHRQQCLASRCRWRFFSEPLGAMTPPGKVSWQGSSITPSFRNWWREWPECSLTRMQEPLNTV